MLDGGCQGLRMAADLLEVSVSGPACRLKLRVAGTDPAPYVEFVDSCRVGDAGHRYAVSQGPGNAVVPQPEGAPDAAVRLCYLLAVQCQFPAECFLVNRLKAPAPAGPRRLDGHASA